LLRYGGLRNQNLKFVELTLGGQPMPSKKESARKKREADARAAHEAGKVDLQLAVVKLAQAIQLLRDTHSSGVQSAERMTEVDQCLDEAIELAGGKEDESDTPIDDESGGGSGSRGE
jgi:hypothetical protein